MKELLSYWDLSLGLIAVGIGSFLQYKRRIYEKKRDNEILRKGESLFKYSRYMVTHTWFHACLTSCMPLYMHIWLHACLASCMSWCMHIWFHACLTSCMS